MTRKRTQSDFLALPKTNAAAGAIMMGAPFVIASRMTQFWMCAAAPTAEDRQEVTDMVAEKMLAAHQSLAAMNVAVVDATIAASTAVMTGTSASNPLDAILSAGLTPYSSKVSANRKRLAKG